MTDQPRTAAGRALLNELVRMPGKPNDRLLREQILAIEAEAVGSPAVGLDVLLELLRLYDAYVADEDWSGWVARQSFLDLVKGFEDARDVLARLQASATSGADE